MDKRHCNFTDMIRKGPTSCAVKSIRDLVACDNSYDSYYHSTKKKSSAQKQSSARTNTIGIDSRRFSRQMVLYLILN